MNILLFIKYSVFSLNLLDEIAIKGLNCNYNEDNFLQYMSFERKYKDDSGLGTVRELYMSILITNSRLN